jgi:hypothetical protein
MEGFAPPAANHDPSMDSKGAQILTRLLTERHGKLPEAAPPPAVQDPSAAPVFRWFGIEPPNPAPAAPASE